MARYISPTSTPDHDNEHSQERGHDYDHEHSQLSALELRVRALETVLNGDTYYQHWLRALEAMVTRKDGASAGELARCRDAWAEAAERAAHGSPIELNPQDLKGLATQ